MAHPKFKISDDSGNTVNVTGNKLDVAVDALDTSPSTFNTVTTIKITSDNDTDWNRFADTSALEVQIQSLSTNIDNFYIGKYQDSPVEGIELIPSAAVSLAINNLQLLSYKKTAHTTDDQILLITVLTNA
mgnify:CR=1 FL=1